LAKKVCMFKDRLVYPKLEKQKDNQKITVLVGARQVGKTTLMRRLYESFGKTHRCLFLDLDIYSNYERVSSYENCINTLKLNGYQGTGDGLFILFLDEFQRYADISRVLKNLSDHHPDIKIYASGSSSLAINEQIQESLAGRKRVFRIYPLNFREYLHFIERPDLIQKLDNLPNIKSDRLFEIIPEAFRELERFMIYGGYPEVALVPDNEKQAVLASVFDLYVKKDLVDFLKVERIQHAKTLIRRLAVNHGQEARFNQLSQMAGIDDKTTKNYIEILKETFLITVHTPWFTNRNKELVKMPKIYFFDSGVRNFFVNNFNAGDVRSDIPYIFEGFVISELIKSGIAPENIKFWRTKNKQEVDMVLDDGMVITPVEIKYKKRLKQSDYHGLYRFREAYPECGPLFMVNPGSNRPAERGVLQVSPFELGRVGQGGKP